MRAPSRKKIKKTVKALKNNGDSKHFFLICLNRRFILFYRFFIPVSAFVPLRGGFPGSARRKRWDLS